MCATRTGGRQEQGVGTVDDTSGFETDRDGFFFFAVEEIDHHHTVLITIIIA